jgi:S-adenosylmethionine:diacylglycerol 3-amino-3-carboxypropyl transferase
MSLTTSNNPLQPQNQRILDEFDKKLKWHEGRKYLFIENQTLVLKGFFRTLISRLFGLKQAKLVDIAELCHQQQLKAPEKLKKCITKLFNRTVIPFLSSRNSALVDRIATSFQNDLLSDSTMRTLATHFNITKDTYEKIGHSISQLPLPQQERSLLFRSVLQGRYDRSWEKARAALEQIVYFALQKGDYALLSNILSRKNIEKLKKAEEKELPRLLASLQLPSDLLRVDMRVDFSTLAQNLQDFTQDKNYE